MLAISIRRLGNCLLRFELCDITSSFRLRNQKHFALLCSKLQRSIHQRLLQADESHDRDDRLASVGSHGD